MFMLQDEYKEKIDSFLRQAIEEGVFPGAVLGIVNANGVLYKEAFGYRQLEPEKQEMTLDTIFDLASLTKVVATTTSIMQLLEQGKLNLWDSLVKFYPEVSLEKSEITVFHLMTHTSGFQAIVQLWDSGLSYAEKIEYILNLPLEYKTGSQVVYSDPNYILLGDLVRKISGLGLDEYVEQNISKPLMLTSTTFNPLKKLPANRKLAATEMCSWRGRIVRGEVHDENAASFDGVSGHAGLFSNVDDLCIFLQMLLNKGTYKEERVLLPQTVQLIRKDWTFNLNQHRGLGWDLIKNPFSSGGVLLSEEAFGHTGFTGTSLWVDPTMKIGVILLSNRVHPSRENTKIITLRPRLHNLIVSTLLSV